MKSTPFLLLISQKLTCFCEKQRLVRRRHSAETTIKNRIIEHGPGWCFTPMHFSDLGSDASIRKALSQLEKQKFIRRLAGGLYDYPKKYDTLGVIPPDLNEVAIDRFSEDIDLSIERDFFGFGTPNNPENAPSKKKQNLIIENLSEACSSYVQNELLRELTNAINAELGTHKGWQLLADSDDPDSKTLLFEYQSKKSNVCGI